MSEVERTLAALRRGDLAGARELDLSGAGLTETPDEVLGLADTLEVLDLGRNRLTGLPPGFTRLRRLQVLFASDNRFGTLPPVLGDLPRLSQLGLRRAGLRVVPAEATPPAIRWLTLTDNALEHLPEALGRRPRLQKLMLAGNRLTGLPASLAGAERLELLRVSANRLEALPRWLAGLPFLAWLAWAGGPLEARAPRPAEAGIGREVAWTDLELGPPLGEGASGRVHAASLRMPGGAVRSVAVKLFKDAVTSDGLPSHEIEAALAAGGRPGLAGALGRLTGHPEGAAGLVTSLLPAAWRPLAGPPSRESCSRDVYDPALVLAPETVRRLALSTAGAAAHLHARGLMHGDLYAHNILWDGAGGEAVLTDFGAASRLPSAAGEPDWTRLETLAWGRLLGELLDRCPAPPDDLRSLHLRCTGPDPAGRPPLAQVRVDLGAAGRA